MLKNYLKIALRNLRRHQVYAFINIVGLGIGMAVCILIMLYIRNELSFDLFHEKADRIYRITYNRNVDGVNSASIQTPLPLAPQLASDFPDIVKSVRLFRPPDVLLQYKDQKFFERRVFFADHAVLEIFSLKFIHGIPGEALKAPNSVILTEEMSRKYFGSENTVGKVLTANKLMEGKIDLIVTAVVQSLPENSHFHFDFLLPFATELNIWDQMMGQDWSIDLAWTYVLLTNKETRASLQSQLPNFIAKHFPEMLRAGTSLDLQPLTDIHLHSNAKNEIEANGSIFDIYVFATIAVLVLLIACINFTNLATVRAADRIKEIGIRKVVGARRGDLIRQFLGESLLLSFVAVALALAFVELFPPFFKIPLGKFGVIHSLNLSTWSFIFIAGLLVGIISGAYPAFFLSGLGLSRVLRGNLTLGSRGDHLRKILVIGQFTASIFLLIATALMSKQLDYLKNKNLGFRKEQLICIEGRHGLNYQAFHDELLQQAQILNVTSVSGLPGMTNLFSYRAYAEGMADHERKPVAFTYAGPELVKTFEFKLVEGRDFYENFSTDATEGVIINQTAAKEFGWQDSAIGKRVDIFDEAGARIRAGRVIGVIEDYHFESMHHLVRPLVFASVGSRVYGNVIVRIAPENLSSALAGIQQIWTKFAPAWPFEFHFLDELLNGLYQQEERTETIMQHFTVLAIMIACLGLLGLASYTAQQRTKEIGIRKVLGASVLSLVRLLSKEFVILVALANLLAWPAAYFAMSRWLQDFAYRITIGWQIFALAGLAALFLALLTVSTQAIKAALANPVDALRYE